MYSMTMFILKKVTSPDFANYFIIYYKLVKLIVFGSFVPGTKFLTQRSKTKVITAIVLIIKMLCV